MQSPFFFSSDFLLLVIFPSLVPPIEWISFSMQRKNNNVAEKVMWVCACDNIYVNPFHAYFKSTSIRLTTFYIIKSYNLGAVILCALTIHWKLAKIARTRTQSPFSDTATNTPRLYCCLSS